MYKVIIASTNECKIAEIKYLLGNNVDVVTLRELGIKDVVVEDGKTYLENAKLKVDNVLKNIGDCPGVPIIGDDTGLEIEAMCGELGLYSARFRGYSTSYEEKNLAILNRMEKETNRKAMYICGICMYLNGIYYSYEGVLRGLIGEKPIGDRKVAFDPIFYVDANNSLDSIPYEDKMKISHRAKAMEGATSLMSKIK